MAERGMTAKELSEKTGISPGNISDWKSGRSAPKADALNKIANALSVSVGYAVNGPNEYMSDVLLFLGKDKYTVKIIDGEDCICRRISNYELELSNCSRKKMSIDLYLWKLSENGTPLHTVAHRFGIKSKGELREVINFVEQNITNIEVVSHQGDLILDSDDIKPLDDQLSELEYALFGEIRDLTDEEKQKILEFAKFTKSLRDKK